MVHLKFGPIKELAMPCQSAFDRFFEDSWIDNEPVFLELIRDVDHSEWLGGGLLRNLETGKRYNFTGLCGGTKMAMCSTMLPQYWWNLYHMGANVYPYLAELEDKYEMHFVADMNPIFYAEFGPYAYPDFYLDDYGVLVTNSEDMQFYLDDWKSKHKESE